MDEELTDDAVRLAYKLFLGRPVENDDVLRFARAYGTVGRLRDALLDSREFEFVQNLRPRLVPPGAPRLEVQTEIDDARALAMLADVRGAWNAAPPTPGDGARQAADVSACLRRNGLPPPDAAHAFELGCGAGRVTRHLAPLVTRLTAADASPAQLAAAQRMAADAGLSNVSVCPADDLRFGMSEGFDLWYSYHALQYSPPPLAARVLSRALELLRPGGVAIFQAITYAAGYAFATTDARPRSADPYDDKHVLPQPVVFGIADLAGSAPVEVFDELSVAPSALWRSTMFVMRKRAA